MATKYPGHIKDSQYALHFYTVQQLLKALKLALAYVIVFDLSSSALLCEFDSSSYYSTQLHVIQVVKCFTLRGICSTITFKYSLPY